VAPNVYYLGSSGSIYVVKNNIKYRISGISGIYATRDFFKTPLENFPITEDKYTSIYHTK
jgi:hypothetical protein